MLTIKLDAYELISDSGSLNANFGNSSHAEGMGNGFQCIVRNDDGKYYLPKGMEAVWVSLVERKVYSVATLLPYNQILKLFKANESLHMIDICLLPGGKFAIYLHGGGDAVMLDNPSYIALVEEDEESLEYISHSNNCDNMDEYFDQMYKYARKDKRDWISYLSKNGTPAPILDKYIQRFNYDFDFEFEDNSATLVSTRSQYLNNERFSETFQHIDKEIHKAMVKFVLANWDDETSRYTCYLYFNEEVLQAFEEAYGGDPKQKGKLKIKVAKDFQSYELSLNVADKSVPLNKTEIRVFARPLSDLDQDGQLVYINYDERQNYFLDDSEYFEKK